MTHSLIALPFNAARVSTALVLLAPKKFIGAHFAVRFAAALWKRNKKAHLILPTFSSPTHRNSVQLPLRISVLS